jgi:hypothetical protein
MDTSRGDSNKMTKAAKNAWKTKPYPVSRTPLNINLSFNNNETNAILNGFVPKSMDDKWFIYSENGWVYFHRSWVGYCIYAILLDLQPNESETRIISSWVNGDSSEYHCIDLKYENELLTCIINRFLLKKITDFPTPPSLHKSKFKIFKHNIGE